MKNLKVGDRVFCLDWNHELPGWQILEDCFITELNACEGDEYEHLCHRIDKTVYLHGEDYLDKDKEILVEFKNQLEEGSNRHRKAISVLNKLQPIRYRLGIFDLVFDRKYWRSRNFTSDRVLQKFSPEIVYVGDHLWEIQIDAPTGLEILDKDELEFKNCYKDGSYEFKLYELTDFLDSHTFKLDNEGWVDVYKNENI